MALIVVLELMAVSVSVVKVILVDQAFVLTQTLKTHTVADQVADQATYGSTEVRATTRSTETPATTHSSAARAMISTSSIASLTWLWKLLV
jgi:hypothetical protein